MALDIEAIRANFPILDRVLPNGKKLVYFDNAATCHLYTSDAAADS